MPKRSLLALGLACLVSGSFGCNSHKPPPGPNVAKTYPTKGSVVFPDNTPLVGGVINFIPKSVTDGGKVRYEGSGLVNEKGEFVIGLNGNSAGIAAGDYDVTVTPREILELKGSNSKFIPMHYRDKASTPLHLTVKAEDNAFQIVLK